MGSVLGGIVLSAIWTTLHRVGLVGTPMTILENNCMQSTASSAGYSTGGTLISAFAASMLVSDTTLSLPLMLAWVSEFFCHRVRRSGSRLSRIRSDFHAASHETFRIPVNEMNIAAFDPAT